jgi:hypothetical protein
MLAAAGADNGPTLAIAAPPDAGFIVAARAD